MYLSGFVFRGRVYGVAFGKWKVRLLDDIEQGEVLRRKANKK